ncbi:MAG: AAC(3) family N-acetyltransferase [Planctomycetes bacterium]|nr:AAC(3) family N-acetyltransferase [Planctomycetota bacterium]
MIHTSESLYGDLSALGVPEGALLAVHSSFRALGQVEGGPEAVVRALQRAVGERGTLLFPTFTTNLTDPEHWPVPPPPEERERLLETIPLFDPGASEPHKMGAIAIQAWKTAGAIRSRHPVSSWTAIGPLAEELARDHSLDDPEGPRSPIGRVHERDGWVLLLGVSHDADTTIHLAESLLDLPHLRVLPDRYPALDGSGRRVWREIAKTTKCSDGFTRLEEDLQRAGAIRWRQVGDARSQLLRSREIVRVATERLRCDPTSLLCDDPRCVHCPTSRAVLTGIAS